MHTVDIALFQNSVAFTLTMSRWGNSRKINIAQLKKDNPTINLDPELVRASKVLIEAEEFDKIVTHQGETRHRLEAMSVPSFFKRGIVLVGNNAIGKVEAYLTSRKAEQEELVMALAQVYNEKIFAAEAKLAPLGLFNSADYPTVQELISKFGMKWNWITFGVPENLPAELREAEKAKQEQIWTDSMDQIMGYVRTAFKEHVQRMVDRLHTDPGDEKKKKFHATAITNLVDFMDMFPANNVTNDEDLAQLVEQAKGLVSGVSVNDIRTNDELRSDLAGKFGELNASIDQLIETMPSRSFDFDEAVA